MSDTCTCACQKVDAEKSAMGDPLWILWMVITDDGELHGVRLDDRVVFSARGRARARRVLGAFGLPNHSEPEDLVGRRALVRLRRRPGGGLEIHGYEQIERSPMTRSDEVLLRRTGAASLLLRGYGLIAHASSRAPQGARQSRWHEIEIWSDDSQPIGPTQRHAVAIRYCTEWQGELGHDHAVLVDRASIPEVLAGYDPVAHVTGYPLGEQFSERQRRLLREIRAGWEHAVSDALEIAKVWEVGG